ncbi:MAG: hypothetical protein GEU28_10580 [Dehalococcoidia bacterium]|nr:hypothetical protein [Dehalococcoidia bacterium]
MRVSYLAAALAAAAVFLLPGSSQHAEAAGRIWTPCQDNTSVYVSGNAATHGYHAWDFVCMHARALVTSPVNGRVVFVHGRIPDHGCSGLGNTVVIRVANDGRFMVLGHLKRGQ